MSIFKKLTAEEKAEEQRIISLAMESAKSYFRSKGLPRWTDEYRQEFPIYVRSFIYAYKKSAKLKQSKIN